MDKKGQLTIFAVLGIVIAFVFLLVYFIESGVLNKMAVSDVAKSLGLSREENVVRDYVEKCVDETGKNALLLAGAQGGYIFPERYAVFEGIKVSYGYYDGKNVLADKNTIGNEIERYYEIMLPSCIDEIKIYEIIKGNLSSNVVIGQDAVDVNINYPAWIIKSRSKTMVEPRYNAIYNLSLGKMRDVANNLVEGTAKNEEGIDIGYLIDIGDDFFVNVVPNDEGRINI